MTFTGSYSSKLNAKNQVTLPSVLREALFRMEDPLPLVLFERGAESPFLEMYPRREWEQVQERTAAEARALKQPELNRRLNSRAMPLHLEKDGDGRLVIPPPAMKRLTPGGEVIFVGNFRRIELWDARTWLDRSAADPATETAFQKKMEEILDY